MLTQTLRRILFLMLLFLALTSAGTFNQSTSLAQCPPNGWYCPVAPGNCQIVGCQKKCADCTYTCAYAKGRECPPLETCLACR
ncbi:MAG: hypothetical protein JWM21_1555 [Acidobacteria bacterium]|nr:hypothetical protein [Acidobacteriota bacterium]